MNVSQLNVLRTDLSLCVFATMYHVFLVKSMCYMIDFKYFQPFLVFKMNMYCTFFCTKQLHDETEKYWVDLTCSLFVCLLACLH